jgi:hypothetical protein
MNFERDFLSNWSENLTPAEESSFDPDLLETIQIAGERVFRKAWHSLDFDSDELHGWVAESGTDKHIASRATTWIAFAYRPCHDQRCTESQSQMVRRYLAGPDAAAAAPNGPG